MTDVHGSECLLGDLIEECGAFSPNVAIEIERFGYEIHAQPEVSVIVPVHNQETVIETNLESMQEHAVLAREFIIIVDGCTDGTPDAVRGWALRTVGDTQTVGITLVSVREGVFETISDSIGARLASGRYLIEIQADMRVWEAGYDSVLIRALDYLPELIAVSGRGAHSFSLVVPPSRRSATQVMSRLSRAAFATRAHFSRRYDPNLLELQASDSIGRIGDLIECHVSMSEKTRPVFVHETIMRGPVATRREDFLGLGGLDTSKFFLGNDDHDFAMRALVHHGRRVGYVPIGFDSPIDMGTTRAPRTPQAESRYRELKVFYAARFAESTLALHAGKIVRPVRYRRHVPLEG